MPFIDPYEKQQPKRGSSGPSSFVDPAEGAQGEEQSPGVLGWTEAIVETPPKAFLGAGAQAGAMIPGLIAGEGLEASVEGGRRAAGKVTDWRMMDRTKGAEETLGEWFEQGIHGVGRGAEIMTSAPKMLKAYWDLITGQKQETPPELLTSQPETQTGAEATAELALFGLPGLLKRGTKPKQVPEVTNIGKSEFKQDLFQDPYGEYTSKQIEEGGRNLIDPEVRSQVTMQGGKMGGILDPRLKAQLERELNPPFDVAERVPGQRELFTDYSRDEILLGEASRGARDKPVRPDLEIRDAPKLTEQEYFGPREKGEFQERIIEYDPSSGKDPWSGEVKLGMGIDAVEWLRKYGPIISEKMRKILRDKKLDQLVFQGIPKGVGNNSPSYWFTTSFEEAKMWANRNGPGGRIAVTLKDNFPSDRFLPSERRDFPNSEHIYMGDLKLRPIEFIVDIERRTTQIPVETELRTAPFDYTKVDKEVDKHLDAYLKSDKGPRGRQKGEITPDFLSFLLTGGLSELGKRIVPSGGGKSPTPAREISAKVKKQGSPTGVLTEAKRDFELDRRPIEEVIKSLEGQKLMDFSSESSNLATSAYKRFTQMAKQNLLIDTTLKVIMKNNPGTSPLIKWTVDQTSRIDREFMQKTKAARETALRDFRKMYWGKSLRPQLQEAMKIWEENTGIRDLGREDFKTDRQYEVYRNFQNVFDNVLGELNKERVAHNLKPIDRIPSYFVSSWEGDYRFFGYDSLGDKKFALAAKTEIGAELMRKDFQKAHPELSWPKVEHVQRNKYGLIDLSAFDETLRVLSKDDPVAEAVRKTAINILQHRGFGRTGLHKKGILGYMGMEPGALGLRRREQAFEQYVQQAYAYIGNLKKQKVLEDLENIPLEMREQIPETKDFLTSYVRKSMGAKLGGEQFYDYIIKGMSKIIGTGETGPRRAITELARIASVYWLLTPKFLLAQPFQSGLGFVKLLQETGSFKEAGKFFSEGWRDTLQPNRRDATTKEFIEYATEKAYLDPTLKNLVTAEIGHGEIPTAGIYQIIKEFGMLPAAKVEHFLVRLPTGLMFEKALRESIPDKKARFEEAAEKMDYYMVNYGRVHTPMIYERAGLAGEAARPLKTFSHNYIGQFIEYVGGLKNRGEWKPLAAFFGLQVLQGGLKGMLGVAEATAIIMALNYLFDWEIPTPVQAISKIADLPEMLIFGLGSTLLGHDISSAVAAPGLPSMFSFPPIEFGIDMVVNSANLMRKKALGIDTDQDRLKAALTLTPILMHEWIKNMWTPEGQPVVNPNDPQVRGKYRRDETDWWSTSILGAKKLSEAKTEILLRETKKDLARDAEQKMDALDAIVDRIKNGQKVDPYLFQKYLLNGGDPRRLSQSIIERLRGSMMTDPERMRDFRTLSPQQMHKLDVMKDYLDKATPERGMFDNETGEIRSIGHRAPSFIRQQYLYSDTPGEGKITNEFDYFREVLATQDFLNKLNQPPEGKAETREELKAYLKKQKKLKQRKIEM